jgi:hypothetical protein
VLEASSPRPNHAPATSTTQIPRARNLGSGAAEEGETLEQALHREVLERRVSHSFKLNEPLSKRIFDRIITSGNLTACRRLEKDLTSITLVATSTVQLRTALASTHLRPRLGPRRKPEDMLLVAA